MVKGLQEVQLFARIWRGEQRIDVVTEGAKLLHGGLRCGASGGEAGFEEVCDEGVVLVGQVVVERGEGIEEGEPMGDLVEPVGPLVEAISAFRIFSLQSARGARRLPVRHERIRPIGRVPEAIQEERDPLRELRLYVVELKGSTVLEALVKGLSPIANVGV